MAMRKTFSIPFVFFFGFISILSAVSVSAAVFEVGPGKTLENIKDVPWEDLSPGDTVLIYYRPQPYREKWVMDRAGTPSSPITVKGIPGPEGQLPVIDGNMAATSMKLNFWSEERGIINIGGSNLSSQTPAYIVIEGLDIRNARPPYWFRDDHGQVKYYSRNAASIYVIQGDHITIKNCRLHDCANGFFACHASGNILVEGCYIFDNGMEGSYYQHNNYTEAKGITFQFNHFGPLREGCGGNNLKDRSAGTIIRYNWIEGGNRQLDLVDSDYQELIRLPSYRKTYVYGNIIVEKSNEGNSQILHYGGDSGHTSRYRKGTLYFYNNTVISKRNGNTTLLRLSSPDESCWAANNIIYATDAGNRLAILNREGTISLRNNWIKAGWVNSHEGSSFSGTVLDMGGNLAGYSPGFANFSGEDFQLASDSVCRDAGTALPADISGSFPVNEEYVKHLQSRTRPADNCLDIGAFEYQATGPANHPPVILSFAADKTIAENPLTPITFNADVSDPDGDTVTLTLDFGDGQGSDAVPVTHSYKVKGSYTAILTATDENGSSTKKSLTITVEDNPPAAPEGVEAEAGT